MIKHIITIRCNRKCSYCITKKLKIRQKNSLKHLRAIYMYESLFDDELMLTGGEPTLATNFKWNVYYGNYYFKKIYLTTQNPKVLSDNENNNFFNSISFSLHTLKDIPEVKLKIPVYACILDNLYNPNLIKKLKALGYSGLTINEEQRNGKKLPRSTKKFSIKINRRGKCLNDRILLPDLTVTNGFKKFM